jgi:hypothetical protein
MEFDVFHIHIAQHVVAGIGHYPIQFLIFCGGGKLSSNGMCLPLATNTAPGQRLDQDVHKLKG